ncbi:hypothetical protein DL89DRAFT_265619 [Linderina pennispora]|uniref:Peripheral subunit-binding (PSBD) domain-containing protein n=1 Tax=Linderina pennispora TaxID=61395 RepID=A0A1Y1WEH3_9FUNG|nr:uncharacterized protein DL89DRAFT_265619 [Linderina pennispora]ORX71917.1 hypothetical protein DL89DRAFT_265619 [Linderina pennispora]
MDVEAQDDGVLVKILAPEGTQNVSVNQPIAIIAEEGDDIGSIDIAALSSSSAAPAAAEAAPEPAAAPTPAAPAAAPAAVNHSTDNSAHDQLSPAVSFAIHANHISNVADIPGSGPKGRILKGDVLSFLKSGKAVINKDAVSHTAPAAAPATTAAAPAKKAGPAPSADAETAFLVKSLESSVLRHLAELELAKKTTSVQIPAEKLAKLTKANKSLSESVFALRAAALALHQVPLGKTSTVGVAVDGSKAPTVVEIADAAMLSVLDLAAAIKEAAKSGKAAEQTPAVILATEGQYTPQTLPAGATVLVVGKPYAAVSTADAGAVLDSALNELISGSASAGKAAKPTALINVSIIGDSPAAGAFAGKIKGFLSNPELLTF